MITEIVYLLETQPYDPISGIIKNVNFSKGLLEESFPGSSIPYPLRLEQAFFHETGVFDNNIPGETVISIGSSTINNADGRFDYLLNYNWDARLVTVKKGLRGDPYASFVTEFIGSSLELTADQDKLILTLRDNSYKLAKPLQTNKYAGTGGKEGRVDLRGKPKPLGYGRVLNATAVLVEPSLLIYQMHDGAVNSVIASYDRANPLTYHTDYASYDLLSTATIAPGEFSSCIAEGFFRLGAPPAGSLTVDFIGALSTYVNIADLARQILLTKGGLSSGDLLGSSFDSAALDAPWNYEGIYWPEPDFQVDELLETLASSVNAFWYVNRQGLITFKQFKFSTSAAIIREEDVVSLGRIPSASPLYRVRVNYLKNATIQPTSDFVIPRQTLNGYLSKYVHHVDASVGSPDYSGAGQFKVFLNDTQVNDLDTVQFYVNHGTSTPWITVDSSGNITVTSSGVSGPSTALLRASIGEFYVEETFTLVRDTAPPNQKISLSLSGDRFYFNDLGAPIPTSQSITATTTSSNTTAPIIITASDNLGNSVPVSGGGVISVADVSPSPLVFWILVTATSADGTYQRTKIMVQRGQDALAAGVLGALAVAHEAVDIYYQTTPPVGAKTDDLWYDTDDANKLYRWNGSSWATISDTRIIDALSAAAGAQATADGKVKTFLTESTPSATALGDLWYKPSTRVVSRWDGSSWSTSFATYGASAGSSGSLYDQSGSNLTDSQVKNTAVSISAAGVLSGAGGGTVTIGGLGFQGDLNATSSENLVVNSSLAVGTDRWVIMNSSVTARTSPSVGDPGYYFRTTTDGTGAWVNGTNTVKMPVPAGALRFYTSAFYRAQGVNGYHAIWFQFYNSSGTFISQSPALLGTGLTGVGPYSSWTLQKSFVDIPSGASQFAVFFYSYPNGGSWVDLFGLRIAMTEVSATDGAKAASNLQDSSGVVLSDSQIKNTAISISPAGALSGAGGGAVTMTSLDTASGTGLISRTQRLDTNGQGIDSRILPHNVTFGLMPSLKDAITISDTANGATVSMNIGSVVFYPDSGGTITFPSATVAGLAYATSYVVKRVGVSVLNPTGTSWNVSTTLSIGVGEVYVTNYTTRATSGSPSPPPPPAGDPKCVDSESWVNTRDGFKRARDVKEGDYLLVLSEDLEQVEWIICESNSLSLEECLRIRCENDFSLLVSRSTPLTLRDGSSIYAPEAEGRELPCYDGELSWSRCSLESVGMREVCHIRCSQRTYAAGETKGKSILTHNPYKLIAP